MIVARSERRFIISSVNGGLEGEKPSDLPVQLVTKVEFIINLKAAKLLGYEFSPSIVSGADEVIE